MSEIGRESAFSWILRALFLLLSIALFTQAAGEAPASMGEEQRSDRLLVLAGLGILGLGMALPWRFLSRGRLPPPIGRNLGFVSKLVGWCGPLLVLLALGPGEPWLLPLGLFASIASAALWARRPWAAYPWYAISAGAFVAAGLLLVRAFSGEPTAAGEGAFGEGYEAGTSLGRVLGPILWTVLGIFLVREVRAWQRAVSADQSR